MATAMATKKRSCSGEHPEPAATAWRCAECARALTGLAIRTKRRGLCESLGEVRRTVECDTCTGRVSLKVYACPKRGEATLSRRLGGVAAVCDECNHWTAAPDDKAPHVVHQVEPEEPDSFRLISPIGTNRNVAGIGRLKPWEYHSTAIIPHLDTPEYLEALIDLLRLQSEPPYVCVVDTGSPFKVCDRLEELRSEDVEIHYVRAGGYSHTSEPVCVALDLGMARANTPLMFLTHTDCFPMRRDALEWLGRQCDEVTPVIGWEMSERSWLTDDWQGMVSHTFTMLHSATMRKIGASWHMGRARDQLGLGAGYRPDDWPDTETAFSYCLREHKVNVRLLGSELNGQRQTTDWWDHGRSYTGTGVYSAGTDHAKASSDRNGDALADAKLRAAAWRRQLR
jgi:hypothetical protein